MRFLLLIILLGLHCGCSTSQDEVYSDDSHPYAYNAEAFMTQEPATYREPQHNPTDFFFKSCSQTHEASHYSRTSYMCDDR